MALFNPMAGKLPAVKLKTPKNIGEEVGSWIGVGPKAKPGTLTGGSDQPIAGGELQKPVLETIGASPLEIGPPGGKTATIADISNPYAEAAKMATGEISGMLPQYKQLYGTGAGALTGLIGDLQAQARGQAGPGMSLGQALLQQGLTQGTGAVQSQLASQRGLSAAQRARMASNQIAALQGQTAQQAGILGLQQQLAAQEQLGKLGTGAATLGSDAQLRGAGLLTGSSQELERMRQNIAAANQAAAAADKARTTQAVTSVLGGAAQVGAAAAGKAHGGRIDGVAPYAGDTPKNDVVPANLSPGEIVIPRTAAGSKKDAKKFIDALDDWDEEPSYGKVLKARQKKNYADGGMIPNDEQMMQEAGQAYLEKQRAPYPIMEKAKGAFDEFLANRVVEPLAQRGYPTLGAALATVPSTAMEALVPSTPDDLMQTVIPFPKGRVSKKAGESGKTLTDELTSNVKRFFNYNETIPEKVKRKLAEKPMSETAKSLTPEQIAKLTPEEKAYEGIPLTRGEKMLLDPELKWRSDWEEQKAAKLSEDARWRKVLEERKSDNSVFANELGGHSLKSGTNSWYDQVGGPYKLRGMFDEMEKLNKGDEVAKKIKEYKKAYSSYETEKDYDYRQMSYERSERIMEDIINYIDKNLDTVLLPKKKK